MPRTSAGGDRDLDPGATPGGWQVAPRLARALIVVVFAGLASVPLLRVLAAPGSDGRRALAVGCLLAVLAVQLQFLSRPRMSFRDPVVAAALLAQAALAYLPFLEFGRSWAGVPSFLAGSCLLVFPRLGGWVAFGLIVVSAAYLQEVLTGDPLEVAYGAVAVASSGLLVYGLTRLAGLVEELRETRAEVARLAVAGERLRVSRDLHDLIGSSISAITLKSELTARLIGTSPDRAYEEITEVVDISRRALADVRSVARGYREMSVLEEALLARSMLLSADVTTRVDVSGIDQLPQDVGTVLGIVIREGVTNVLRHSNATNCEISIRRTGPRVDLEMVNDGVVSDRIDCAEGGSGLDSLAFRVAELSGWLTAETLPGRRWRLCATIVLPDGARHPPVATPNPDGFCDARSA